jgi:hypothetical protein
MVGMIFLNRGIIKIKCFVPQLKRFDDAFFYHKGTKGTKVSQRTVVRQPFVLLCTFVVKK